MSTKNYNPNQVFIICTLPNGTTANIMSDLPNDQEAIKIKYKEPLCEVFGCLDGSIYTTYNSSTIGVMEIKILADSDTKLIFNGLVASNGMFSMTIRNKSQTGDLLVMTNISITDSGSQTYGAAGERVRVYKLIGKIQAML